MKKVPEQKRSRRLHLFYAPFHQQIKFESEQSTHFSTANKIVPSILVTRTDIATLTIQMQICQVVEKLSWSLLEKYCSNYFPLR